MTFILRVSELEKKICSYLQKIALEGILPYNESNMNGDFGIVLKGGLLLQSFVNSHKIIPEIINDPTKQNLSSYDIDAELLLNGLDISSSQVLIDNTIRDETRKIYEFIINKLYKKGPYIDILLFNLNKVLRDYGFTFNLDGEYNDNIMNVPTGGLTNNILNNLYKRFIKYEVGIVAGGSEKKLGKFYLDLIKLQRLPDGRIVKIDGPAGKAKLRFFDLTYTITNMPPQIIGAQQNSYAIRCCEKSEVDNQISRIINMPEKINNSLFFIQFLFLPTESFHKFLGKLYILGYTNANPLKRLKNKDRFDYLKDKLYSNDIYQYYRKDKALEDAFFNDPLFFDNINNEHFFQGRDIPVAINPSPEPLITKDMNRNISQDLCITIAGIHHDNFISIYDRGYINYPHDSIIYHYTVNSSKYNVAIIKYYLTNDVSYLGDLNQFNYQPIDFRGHDMTYGDYHQSLKDIFRKLKPLDPNDPNDARNSLNNSLPDEYYVYRGIGLTNINNNNIYEAYQVGNIITNPTVCSTSTELFKANSFMHNNTLTNCGIFRISMKKRDKCLFLEDDRSTGYLEEYEVLLPPECKFKITSIRYVKYSDFDTDAYRLTDIRYTDGKEQSPFLLIDVEYIEPDYITNYIPQAENAAQLPQLPQVNTIVPSPNTYINLDFNSHDYLNVYNPNHNNNNAGYGSNNNQNTLVNSKGRKNQQAIFLKQHKLLMKLLFDDKLMKQLKEKMDETACEYSIDFNIEMLLDLIAQINRMDATRETNKLKSDLIAYLQSKLYLNDISNGNIQNYYLFDTIELYNLLMTQFSSSPSNQLNQLGGKKKGHKGGKMGKTKIRKHKVTRKKNHKLKQTKKRH
jgi:predicted house-cleaning noncanonical NTP pyrophosphatase (MazG superfamily)